MHIVYMYVLYTELFSFVTRQNEKYEEEGQVTDLYHQNCGCIDKILSRRIIIITIRRRKKIEFFIKRESCWQRDLTNSKPVSRINRYSDQVPRSTVYHIITEIGNLVHIFYQSHLIQIHTLYLCNRCQCQFFSRLYTHVCMKLLNECFKKYFFAS